MRSTLTLTTDYGSPVSAAAQTVTAGYAVCELLDGTGYATATTANLALAGGKFAGIAITSGGPRSPIGVVVVGPVPAQVVGALSGSGDYVNVNASGGLFRTTSISSATIGIYQPTGNVVVSLFLQNGIIISGDTETVTLSGTGTGPAGAFAVGDIVCSANDATDQTLVKLAVAANLANADAASFRVMVETGIAGEAKQAAKAGDRLSAAALGFSAATTIDWATLNTATGRAVRTTKATLIASQYVIGETDKQGNTTLAPRTPGHVVETDASLVSGALISEGTKFRARRGIYNLLDFKVSGAFPDETGTTPVDPWIRAAIAAVPSYSTIYTPLPSSFFRLEWTSTGAATDGPIILGDDDEHGNKKGIHFVGEGPPAGNGGKYHFRIASKIKRGTAASLTALSNGGTQTFTADPSTDLITYASDLPNYCRVRLSNSGGALPAPLLGGATDYWIIRQSATTAKLAPISASNVTLNVFRDITDAGTGTHTLDPGDKHQTWSLGAGLGITVATKARWIGRYFVPEGCANDENHGDHIIIDVTGDGVIRVSNINDSPGSTDANNGFIRWSIQEPQFAINAKDVTFQNLNIGMTGAGDVSAFVEFGHPAGTNGRTVACCQILGCQFSTDAASSGSARDFVQIARGIVPGYTGTNNYRGVNGLGETQYTDPSQLDTFYIFQSRFNATVDTNVRAAIANWSVQGQTKEDRAVEVRATRTQFLLCTPKDRRVSSTWTAGGKSQWDLLECGSMQVFDTFCQAGSFASKAYVIRGCYSESGSRIFTGFSNGVNSLIVRDNHWVGDTSSVHGSGAWITTGAREVILEKNVINCGDGHALHVEFQTAHTNHEDAIVLRENVLDGQSNYQCAFGIRQSTIKFPIKYGGGERIGFKVDGGAQVDVLFSQTNFNNACGYTVDLNRVHAWEWAKVVTANVSGARAWGDGDDAYAFVRSLTNSSSGSIRMEYPVPATTFTANAGTDVITHTGLDMPTGSRVRVSTTTTLPSPLVAATDYWTVRQSSSTSKLYPTLADAYANTNVIDLADAGTGTHKISPDGNQAVGFGLAATSTNRAQTRLAKDSSNWVDWGFTTGTSGKVALKMEGNRHLNHATGVQLVTNDVDKRINSGGPSSLGGFGQRYLENIGGISATNGPPCKNLYKVVTISAAATTATWTFDTDEEDTAYDVIVALQTATATAAAGSLIPQSLTKATGSVILTLRAAPGGSDAVTYILELRR